MVLFLLCYCIKATYIFEDWLFSYFHNINFRHLFLIIVDYIILSNTPAGDTRKPEQICIHLSVLESKQGTEGQGLEKLKPVQLTLATEATFLPETSVVLKNWLKVQGDEHLLF